MLLWINDALMAVFFLLIGLEVKREMIQGSLASRQAVFRCGRLRRDDCPGADLSGV
jgi:Na+/H+ antiporter NhaA